MSITINNFLSGLRQGDPVLVENLAVVPLFHDQNIKPDYITLKEGIKSDLLEVSELDDRASVNDILLRNKSDSKALLFEGEEFKGAMQNRILNVSILVEANSKQRIPVSCVEAGRWHYDERESKSRKFELADRLHYARGRAKENRAVSLNLESRRAFRGNQSEVWSDIELKSERMSASSDTSASEAMYESRAEMLDRHVKSFKHAKGQIGSLFLVDGQPSGLEVFASEVTHRKLLRRLVRSHALDALDPLSKASKSKDSSNRSEKLSRAASKFIADLGTAWTKEFDAIDLGKNVRFKDDRLTGGALVHDERVLHLCAFPVE